MDACFREKLVIGTKGIGNPSLKLVCHIRKLFFLFVYFYPHCCDYAPDPPQHLRSKLTR